MTAGRQRHCMVVHARYPVGETRVQRQAMALKAAGFDVTVICLREAGEPAREDVDGVQVIRLPVSRHRGSGMSRQLVEYLSFFALAFGRLTTLHLRNRFRSVQVHNLPDFLVFCALVPRFTGARVIIDLHDLMPEFFEARTGTGGGGLLARLVRLQERWSCRFAHHVITVTEGWRRTLGDRAVPVERISVVMNLADPSIFHVSPRSEPDRGELRIIYHGTFAFRYGVDLLVDAVERLVDRLPGVRLRLLGDGELRPDLMERIERGGLGEIVFVSDGMLDAALLPENLAWADVGVVPNRSDVFTEGILPTKLLEYVASGVPAIVARTGMVTEYFADDMVAFFDPGDVGGLVERLAAAGVDRAAAAEMAARALRFQQDNSWEAMIESYLTAITGRPARPPSRQVVDVEERG